MALDASGFGNHGSPNSAAQLATDRDGNADSAFLFDGISARIDIPHSASLVSPTSETTMAAWIRRDGWGMVGQQYNPILTKSTDTANDFQYRLIVTPSGLGTAFNSWNESRSATSTYDEGVWYHVASTWKAGTLRSYVNGSLIDSPAFAVTIHVDERSLSIGSDTPGVLEIFYGAIDDVRIYDRALTDGDVQELYGPPVEVLNARGRRVRTLHDHVALGAGTHTVRWDGCNEAAAPVANGVYFYRLSTADGSRTGRAVVLR